MTHACYAREYNLDAGDPTYVTVINPWSPEVFNLNFQSFEFVLQVTRNDSGLVWN